jgi:cadmium resistance protein CadD (predicted permease)
MNPLKILGVSVVLFASTNVDDIFVLVGFFADMKYRPRDIVTGQYVGIAALFAVSLAGSLLSLVISPAYIGLLGIVAIGLGAKKIFDLFRSKPEGSPKVSGNHTHVTSIALVTLANGADNVSLYMPAFAGRSGFEIGLFAVVFACMTALWCFIAYRTIQQPTLGAPFRRYGRYLSPLVLIGLGLVIMFESGTFRLIHIRPT